MFKAVISTVAVFTVFFLLLMLVILGGLKAIDYLGLETHLSQLWHTLTL